jgi:uncharacterized protein
MTMPTIVITDPIAHTQLWVERSVIGLNLCPFAKAVQAKGRVRYVLSQAMDDTSLMLELSQELARLAQSSAQITDTTLIVIPHLFADFSDFNDFLGEAEDELWVQGYEGEFQLASFHPQYQFADTQLDDVQNNTNRSPYPTLHILREASMDAAVAAFPDTTLIYEANIATMNQLGPLAYNALLKP